MADLTPKGRSLGITSEVPQPDSRNLVHLDRRYAENPTGNRAGTYPYGRSDPWCETPDRAPHWTSDPDRATCVKCRETFTTSEVFKDWCLEREGT